jgi:hypothetical protein
MGSGLTESVITGVNIEERLVLGCDVVGRVFNISVNESTPREGLVAPRTKVAEKVFVELEVETENVDQAVENVLGLFILFVSELTVAVDVVPMRNRFSVDPQQRPFSSPSQQYSRSASVEFGPRGILHRVM